MSFRANQPLAEATRNPTAGKGTGNFLDDEKVASPHLDARFRGHDAVETTALVCELTGHSSGTGYAARRFRSGRRPLAAGPVPDGS